jgi:hypothetical protein
VASLIRVQLNTKKYGESADAPVEPNSTDDDNNDDTLIDTAIHLAKQRFIDLTTTTDGQHILENLFTLLPPPPTLTPAQIKHAVIALQSLLIYAMQTGVKGSEEHQTKLVRHLFRRGDIRPPDDRLVWISPWTTEDIRRLKFYRNGEIGKGILAALKRRRTSVGAYELLREMGVWKGVGEEVMLLRSGFPVRFLEGEVQCAVEVSYY